MASKASIKRARERERRRALAYQARIRAKQARRRRNQIIAGITVAALALGGVVWLIVAAIGGDDTTTATETVTQTATETASETPVEVVPEERATYTAVPDASLAEDRTWSAVINTSAGSVALSLDGVNAPQAVANFITLAQDGYYNGSSCHRLTTEGIYVLQCGSLTGDGTDNPGYTFGPLENVPEDGIYPRGTVAMARAGTEDSQGAQFFIVYQDTELPGGYSVFGEVTAGMEEIIDAVAEAGVDPASSDTGDGPPAVPLVIDGIETR